MIYDEVREALKSKLTEVCEFLYCCVRRLIGEKYLKDCCHIADHLQRKTITVSDVSSFH